MDPVGPWSTYASYNRLAGVQPSAGGADLHHHLPASGAAAPPATTAQLIPGGFLSPPPVAYETVFTPLFHHAGAKAPTHYVTQHRAKQAEGDYHQAAFFEQGAAAAWQQNSPFGILPHESVVATTKAGATYENFSPAHFAAQSLNHLNSQLAKSARAQSPAKTAATQAGSVTFFQVSANVENSAGKAFAATNTTNLQQSCIVSSSSNSAAVSKEYRVPQAQPRPVFISSSNRAKPQNQIQTKAQTKIYPELNNQPDRPRNADEPQSQSSPISFTSSYNSSAKRPAAQFQHSTYRHYQPGNVETDFQRPKSGSDYPNANGPDCSVAVPRRPSPLQAHSQTGHAPSPAYPMYNSPMNPISSPQQNSNHVTPPSPLDASVPRPSPQTGNVAYPSVITRALNTEKTFQERYDRPVQQNSPNCWQDRSRKFAGNQTNATGNSYGAAGNSIEIPTRQIELPNRTDAVPQRTAGVQVAAADRQQGYFEAGHQVTLQDLSSCRGDPMTIVKNLQQTCNVPQGEVKQEVKTPAKRRKSNDKAAPIVNEAAGGSSVEYFSSRIPPPAHSSAANQQQQNGTYFDFDRWNLPPPTSKIFSTQAVHQQHQGLMVPHPHTHHPPPPLPYFPPFHLPPHPPEFSSSVELAPVAAYNEQSAPAAQYAAAAAAPPPEDNQPKVVVPNIEEELNFLSEGTVQTPATNSNSIKPLQSAVAAITKPTDKPTGPGAGFMSSYLKFLQGERDSSPPPATRGARKQTWSRTPKPIQEIRPPDVNGIVPPVIPPPPPVTRLSQGDPQDDPRYFPLPKERKRSLDSSDEGLSSDDDLFNRKVQPVITKNETSKERGSRKGRQPRSDKKRTKKEKENEKKLNSEDADGNNFPPRRETSKRAAKEKINMKQLIAKQDDDPEEPPEFADSDSDPAWTPQAKTEVEEEPLDKRRKRGRPAGSRKKGVKNFAAMALQHEIDGVTNDTSQSKKQKNKQKQQPLTLEDNIAAAVAVQQNAALTSTTAVVTSAAAAATDTTLAANADENPFKLGEFVAIKSELNQEWPAIWRVDGKTLLQKYEPFEQNGQTLYRNISTYTSWTPESKKQYVAVPVRCKGQSQMETVVEFLRNEMMMIDQEFFDRVMKECEMYQDNFEVYIQTLISQALDSNFLTEIFQEKDEYFLSNVKTIDDVTESKKHKLLSLLGWPISLQAAVSTWPCYNVIRELNSLDVQVGKCSACSQTGIAVRVLMYGQPYNSTTLEGCQPGPQTTNEKDFLMCRICANRIELLNKITHQKYLMYIECAKRVTEKRTAESHKDTTCILNELLADEHWLNQLFLEVRNSWAEVDSLEHSYRLKKQKCGDSS